MILAWHNDPALKDAKVLKMKEHRAADAFVQSEYQRVDKDMPLGYVGCAIGCLLDLQPIGPLLGQPAVPGSSVFDDGNAWHIETEKQFGIPADLASYIDSTFENFIEHADASDFAVDVVEAIPVGADLSDVSLALENWIYQHDLATLGQGRSGYTSPDEVATKMIELIRTAPVPGDTDNRKG